MHTIIIIQTIYKEEELYHEKESNAFCVCIYTSFRAADATFETPFDVISSAKRSVNAPKLSVKTVKLTAGKKKTVKLKNKPKKATVKWSSKNKKIATVSKKGKITAKKAGKTKVICKVTYKKGKKKVSL